LPKIALFTLLNLRTIPKVMPFTFQSIEKLCDCYYEDEDIMHGRNGSKGQKLLPIEPEVAYKLLSSNLATLKTFIEVNYLSRKNSIVNRLEKIGSYSLTLKMLNF